MRIFVLACCGILGGIGIFLETIAIMNLIKRLFYAANRAETTGTVVGYEEKISYTHQTPRRLIREYFPKIKYETDRSEQIVILRNTRRNTVKAYGIGDNVRIGYHRRCPGYCTIIGDCRHFLPEILPFAFGRLYFFLLHYFLSTILGAPESECSIYTMVIPSAVLAIQSLRLVLLAATAKIYRKKNGLFSLQGAVLYGLISCAAAFS